MKSGRPKAKTPRPTDCGHGEVTNGCAANFSLHVCQACARGLFNGTMVPKLVPLKPIAEVAGDLICELHPSLEWPHDDCPGPGMPMRNALGLLKRAEDALRKIASGDVAPREGLPPVLADARIIAHAALEGPAPGAGGRG